MKIKRIIGILILLAIVPSFSSCKKKPYESSAPAQNGAANSDNVEVNTIEDAYTEISAVGTASEKNQISHILLPIFFRKISER